MAQLLNITITTAVSITAAAAVTTRHNEPPTSVAIFCNFVYGSGGTTVNAYLQTSIDGGANWIDIAQFSFTTASAKKMYNLVNATAISTQGTCTDGAMSANTSVSGFIGNQFRIKYVTTGTYAGSTTLTISIAGRGL